MTKTTKAERIFNETWYHCRKDAEHEVEYGTKSAYPYNRPITEERTPMRTLNAMMKILDRREKLHNDCIKYGIYKEKGEEETRQLVIGITLKTMRGTIENGIATELRFREELKRIERGEY